jgi:hypothetical protein
VIKPNHEADKKRQPAHVQNFSFALQSEQFKGDERHFLVDECAEIKVNKQFACHAPFYLQKPAKNINTH